MGNTLLLLSTRWKVDSLIKDPISGDLWYLKALIIDSKITGITECCEYNFECDYHKEVRIKSEIQNEQLN